MRRVGNVLLQLMPQATFSFSASALEGRLVTNVAPQTEIMGPREIIWRGGIGVTAWGYMNESNLKNPS